MTVHVSVPLDEEQAARIEAIAAARAETAQEVLAEAVASYLDFDAWFVSEVAAGIASADAGPNIPVEAVHDELRSRISRDVG